MMTEETARRIAAALERIAERLGPTAAGASPAKLMPGASPDGWHVPGGVTTIQVRPIGGAGG